MAIMIQCIGLEVCGMQVSQTSLSELIPYINNSRTHSDQQVSQIAASIKEFGFNNPILIDGDNGIIAGHGRVLAARKLNLDKVPTIELEHLTDAQRKAYIIADNKLALNADWDIDLLKLEVQELNDEKFDLTLTGFNTEELDGLFFVPNFEPGNENDQGDLDKLCPKVVECPHCGENFDLRDNDQG